MDVLYTINGKFLDIALASIYSLVINSKFEYIRLHIVTTDFSKENYIKLKEFINQFYNVELYTYKLEDNPIEQYNIPNFKGTQISNARLFYPRIIKDKLKNIKNLLYIDADTIVIDDLTGLNSYNNYPINACKESILKSYYEDNFNINNYYNTGVLYYNLDKWISLDVEERITYFQKHNNIKLSYPDQDILNAVFNDDINTMPLRYNMCPYPYVYNNKYLKLFYNEKYRQIGYEEVVNEKENAKILHSAGLCNIKPWTNNNINPFNDIFMNFINEVNADFQKEDLSKIKKLFNISPSLTYNFLMLRTYLPKNIDTIGRNLSLKIMNKK